MKQHRFRLLCVVGLFLTLLLAVVCLAQEKTPASPTNGPLEFKNLQVLKGKSVQEVYADMRNFDQSLGVGCGFCHVSGYDKDKKPQKKKARQMLLMTRHLNTSYPILRGKITCWTCHAGKQQPVTSLP